LPLFTHVEDIPAVLESVEQILADRDDAAAASRLRTLAAQVAAAGPGAAWRALFEQASALRDHALLRRVQFDALLFIKRKPYDSEQPFMDAHHCVNRPGGAIYRLSPVRPGGAVTPVVDSLGVGIYRDLCLHWDADRFLFAFGNGSDRGPTYPGPKQYDIFQARADGSGLRRLTKHPRSDAEPLYLPDGQIAFTSDRSGHVVMCGSNIHAPTLHVMNPDGSHPRQLSFNVFNDINPCILPDGRILYTRWEYNERSVTTPHKPFTMNPDGTMVEVYYGNATIRPNVVMYPRPVPGSRKIMGLFTAHHGQTHGPIALIDTARGLDGPEPFTLLTPGVPNTGEKHEDSFHGWFTDPMPLSEDTYLCSFTPTCVPWLENAWALYVGDRHGNLALVYRDPAISCFEPAPLVRRPKPHVREPAPPDTDRMGAEATLLVLDAHVGLQGVPRGAVKFLRILEDLPRIGVPEGGVIVTSGTGIYTVKRIHGIVPVEADGSAHFVAPANRNLYFEALDARQQEIQRMRSVVCLKPGERRTCVGCHESRNTSPPNRRAAAARRAASRADPPPWGTKVLSFLRDVQPLLNDRCARCHTHDRAANRVILTDDLTDQFSIAYEELLPYVKVANAFRWDHPDDVLPRPPYTYGSKVSALTKLLAAGHHDVRLGPEEHRRLVNWIDANAVYYDRYEAIHPKRSIFLGAVRKSLNDVHTRRCAPCHGKSDGRRGTWWLSLNRRDVTRSRALAAPLARSAGGWGRCDARRGVFADTRDRDYRKLLAALTALRSALAKR
ncbi:PD40 domain-containing protein, partial [bacterium]|nr:PD40 domain-containing protein [bacterium]